MSTKYRFFIKPVLIVFLSCTLSAAMAGTVGQEQEAKQILETTGVKGGFIVCVGCEDGKRLVSLGTYDRFVVQGLCDNPEVITAAREQIKSAGLYGKVSIGYCNGTKLPYVDSIVNLLVISDVSELSADEIKRVLSLRRWTQIGYLTITTSSIPTAGKSGTGRVKSGDGLVKRACG